MFGREFGPPPADLEGPSVANTLHRICGTVGSFAPVGFGVSQSVRSSVSSVSSWWWWLARMLLHI
jgi:hypothetical protein